MLTLYVDESGHEDNTAVFTVGGYLSNDERWALLEREWAAFTDVMRPARKMMTHGAPIEAGKRFPPLTFCLRVVLEHFAQTVTDGFKRRLPGQIKVVVEEGGKWQSQALAYCRWLIEQPRWCRGIYSTVVTGKKQLPGCQAADIIANRTYAAPTMTDARGRIHPDKWMRRMKNLNRGPGSFGYFAIRQGGRLALEQIVAALKPWYESVSGGVD
jgi:hypothetical protein